MPKKNLVKKLFYHASILLNCFSFHELYNNFINLYNLYRRWLFKIEKGDGKREKEWKDFGRYIDN